MKALGPEWTSVPPAFAGEGRGPWRLPPLELLSAEPAPPATHLAEALEPHALGATLLAALRQVHLRFRIAETVMRETETAFTLLPERGTWSNRLTGERQAVAPLMDVPGVRFIVPDNEEGPVEAVVLNPIDHSGTLRGLLERDGRAWPGLDLPLAFGRDAAGSDVVPDLAVLRHVLIGGAAGSGVGTSLNALLAGLLMTRAPDRMRLLLIGASPDGLAALHGLPHLLAPGITDPVRALRALRWLQGEIERRFVRLAQAGVRDSAAYRQLAEARAGNREDMPCRGAGPGLTPMPRIVGVIGELAELVQDPRVDIGRALSACETLGPAVGIHLLVATRAPSLHILAGCGPGAARVALRAAWLEYVHSMLTSVPARVLRGRGDMMLQVYEGGLMTTRIQGAWITPAEIDRVAAWWRTQAGPAYVPALRYDPDGTLEPALGALREDGHVTPGVLQRGLHVGRARAMRRFALLETRGAIIPRQDRAGRETLAEAVGRPKDGTETGGSAATLSTPRTREAE